MDMQQTGEKLRILVSNAGGEYAGRDFRVFFEEKLIAHGTSCAHISQQESYAKKKTCAMIETLHLMLTAKRPETFFWKDADGTAAHI